MPRALAVSQRDGRMRRHSRETAGRRTAPAPQQPDSYARSPFSKCHEESIGDSGKRSRENQRNPLPQIMLQHNSLSGSNTGATRMHVAGYEPPFASARHGKTADEQIEASQFRKPDRVHDMARRDRTGSAIGHVHSFGWTSLCDARPSLKQRQVSCSTIAG